MIHQDFITNNNKIKGYNTLYTQQNAVPNSKKYNSSHKNQNNKSLHTPHKSIKFHLTDVSMAASLLRTSNFRRFRQLQNKIYNMVEHQCQAQFHKNKSFRNSYPLKKITKNIELNHINENIKKNMKSVPNIYENIMQQQSNVKENVELDYRKSFIKQNYYQGAKKTLRSKDFTRRIRNKIIIPLPYFVSTSITNVKHVNLKRKKQQTYENQNNHHKKLKQTNMHQSIQQKNINKILINLQNI